MEREKKKTTKKATDVGGLKLKKLALIMGCNAKKCKENNKRKSETGQENRSKKKDKG